MVAVGATIAAVALVALLLFGGGGGYTVTARFINAGQLVKGNPVQTGGAPIGSVKDIEITDDGQAEITFSIEDDYAPLPRGHARGDPPVLPVGHRQPLRRPHLPRTAAGGEEIADGGRDRRRRDRPPRSTSTSSSTRSTRRPARRCRTSSRARRASSGAAASRRDAGFHYLNPALATSSRLFNELTRDTPVLERFLVDSSKLVTALAERRDDLAALVGNPNETTRALGNQKAALAESIERLPPFMRRANTTFVNLRAALDDVDPLVDASKPVAKRLGPFLTEARALRRRRRADGRRPARGAAPARPRQRPDRARALGAAAGRHRGRSASSAR